MIDVTNGGIRIEQGADGTDTILISAPAVDMAIAILESELPWVINTLGDIHRELIANARRVEDAVTIAAFDTRDDIVTRAVMKRLAMRDDND